MLLLLLSAAIATTVGFIGYVKARDFVARRLRFVDSAQNRSLPILAGIGATVLGLLLVPFIPFVGGGTALALGIGVGTGPLRGPRTSGSLATRSTGDAAGAAPGPPRPVIRDEFVNLWELEAAARERFPDGTFDYYAGGANDEITLRENVRAYDRIAIRYRVLVGVEARDTTTTILGVRHRSPILIAPMAFQRLAHPDGELATARGAAAAGVGMVLSSFTTTPVEEVRSATAGPLWFQLYVFRERDVTRALVQRAEAAGCEAIVLTADTPLIGRRERDVRNRYALPPELVISHGLANVERAEAGPADAPLHAYLARSLDPTLSWTDIDWLRSVTRLPILVKGIVRGDDARRAVEHGAAGVIVSNHGGRQLDTAPATITVLREVVDAVEGRADVLIDGGIRRGTAILKALALGARAVLVGRPILWGLALEGERGVQEVLEMLAAELDLAMALAGTPTIADITADLVSF